MRNLKVRHARVESGVVVVDGRFDAASHFGSVFVDAHNERGKAGMAKAKRERGRARVVEGMRLETNGFGVGG